MFLYTKLFKLECEDDGNNIANDNYEQNTQKEAKDFLNKNKLELDISQDNKSRDQFNQTNQLSISPIGQKQPSIIELMPSKNADAKAGVYISPTTKRKISEKNKNEIILNKDLNNIIDFFKKERKKITINRTEKFYFNYCCFNKNSNKKLIDVVKFEIINAIDAKLDKDLEIIELLKLLDQLKLL